MKSLINFAKRHIVIVVVLVAALALGANYYYTTLYIKGTLIGTNGALKLYPIIFGNVDNTTFFRVDSVGNVYHKGTLTQIGVATFTAAPVFTAYPTFSTVVAGIDSFTTTAATDSITIGSGFTDASIVFVSQINPDHSVAIDTAVYSGQVVTTGANLVKLCVTRAKTHVTGAAALKSGAQYAYEVRKP
jgi:hypothetical protein